MLLVVVINAPHTSSSEVRADNERLLSALRGRFALRPFAEAEPSGSGNRLPPCLIGSEQNVTLVCVVLNRPPFDVPDGWGVGFARKTGNDVALAAWQCGALDSPWLYQTDADVVLPDDYFTRPLGDRPGAVLFPFRHIRGSDADAHLATLQVEVRLRYHVLGLRWAGSPFAWHSIGSCLAVHAQSYAAVHGFPKRAAGEDFHLLQKIQKVAQVERVEGKRLSIRSRRSQRTPFGTGPSVEALLSRPGLFLDDPRCYLALRHWLGRLERFVLSRSPDHLRLQAGVDDPVLTACEHALGAAGVFDALPRLAGQTRNPDDLRTRVHAWFDGLKTQQLIHSLRELGFPRRPAEEVLRTARFVRPWLDGGLPLVTVDDWALACECLERLEENVG